MRIPRFLPVFCVLVLAGCLSPVPEKPVAEKGLRVATTYDRISGWAESDPRPGFDVFMQSCRSLKRRDGWRDACEAAEWVDSENRTEVLRFFHEHFTPHRLQTPDGESTGLITGYYVPNLNGSREPSDRFSWPLYGVPDDLLVIDLREVYPALGDYRLRGRVEGRRVVPYLTRAEIDGEQTPLEGHELLWVDDPVELFFLHIQGSGRIQFEDGSATMVNYADQNGHPYRSIGKLLLDRGEMTRHQMSMQNIRAWARDNPDKTRDLLDENPSYIFFRELDTADGNPPGAMGLPLTPGYSLAVDPRYVPLGAPAFLDTRWPGEERPLRRLMGAQDTGGAIRGAVRGDFYWGVGEEAGNYAGRMKQQGALWLLLPRESEKQSPPPAGEG
jgi:membrane-bound lytic murein transglycosylase A